MSKQTQGVGASKVKPNSDYDGDGRTDRARFNPADSTWHIVLSRSGQDVSVQWGSPGDTPTPGDYNGDGTWDMAVFRPLEGNWYILEYHAPDIPVGPVPWPPPAPPVKCGELGDIPVPADYDGDGRTDPATFAPSSGLWTICSSKFGTFTQPFGSSTDIPIPFDVNGDGSSDVVYFRPSDGTWYATSPWFPGSGSPPPMPPVQWGIQGDVPVPADYDGDGLFDYAVYRPSASTWYVISSSTGVPQTPVHTHGLGGDGFPTPGDYDGDGRADFALFYSSLSSYWHIWPTQSAMAEAFPWVDNVSNSGSSIPLTQTQRGGYQPVGPTSRGVQIESLEYFRCASEYETCTIGGTKYVAFGANGSFVFQPITGSFQCDRSTFGWQDPAPGAIKECYFSNFIYSSKEGANDTAYGEVAYGANGKFNFKQVLGDFQCNNQTFGDPIPGVKKACYSLYGPFGGEFASRYSLAAYEGQLVPALYWSYDWKPSWPVAYGANGHYVYANVVGSFPCSNDFFGDPAPGVQKSCYRAQFQSSNGVTRNYMLAHERESYRPLSDPGKPLRLVYGSGLNGNFLFGENVPAAGACGNDLFGDPDIGNLKHCFGPIDYAPEPFAVEAPSLPPPVVPPPSNPPPSNPPPSNPPPSNPPPSNPPPSNPPPDFGFLTIIFDYEQSTPDDLTCAPTTFAVKNGPAVQVRTEYVGGGTTPYTSLCRASATLRTKPGDIDFEVYNMSTSGAAGTANVPAGGTAKVNIKL